VVSHNRPTRIGKMRCALRSKLSQVRIGRPSSSDPFRLTRSVVDRVPVPEDQRQAVPRFDEAAWLTLVEKVGPQLVTRLPPNEVNVTIAREPCGGNRRRELS
jgi:hypothetical protein